MSRVDPEVEDLRAKAKAAGANLGWKALGEAVQRDGETLRQFAKKEAGTSAHPSTIAALRAYFYPKPISELAARAQEALDLIQQGQAILSEVVRRMPPDPVPIIKQTVKAVRADLPRADESGRQETPQAAPRTTRPLPDAHGE